MYYYFYETVIGNITLSESNGKLTGCYFGKIELEGQYKESPYLKKAAQQLNEYLAGQRKEFDIEYMYTRGTPFQHKVWDALQKIPYGEVASYKDIAEMVGSPKAFRAVGGANNKNPISIFIPCHRIIGQSGKLVGYGGGLDKKEFLLKLEKR